MSLQVKLTSRGLATVTAGVAGSGGGRSAQTHDAAGAERDGGMVDARSPPPGAATERAELWLEGNPYSPLPSRLRGGRRDRGRRAKGAPPRQVTEALSASSLA